MAHATAYRSRCPALTDFGVYGHQLIHTTNVPRRAAEEGRHAGTERISEVREARYGCATIALTTGVDVDWDALAAVAGAVAAALAAVAGAVAADLAAWQLWRIRVNAFDTRAAEIASVAIVTTVVERPKEADNRAGRGVWVYEFCVHNPGRLSISDVCTTITFHVMCSVSITTAPSKRLLEFSISVHP